MSPMDRRTALRALGAGTAAAVAGCLGARQNAEAQPAGSDGTDGSRTFQYDAANTGARADARGPTGDFSERWAVPIELQNALGTTQPVVADGTVYVGTAAFGGEWPSAVLAVDAEDGAEEWRFDAEYSILTTPTVVDDRVFVVTDEKLRALSAADGDELWSVPVGRPAGPGCGPTVVDGTAYVGGEADCVVAVDADSGDREWTGGVGSRSPEGIAVGDGRVVAVEGRQWKGVVALDPASGDELWRTSLGSADSYPIKADGTVFVLAERTDELRGSTRLVALEGESGDVLYEYPADDPDPASRPTTMAVGDDIVFVTRNDGGLSGVDLEGTERWRIDLTDVFFPNAPVVADGVAYLAGSVADAENYADADEYDGVIYGVAPDGDVVLERPIYEGATGAVSQPIAVGETLYLGVMTKRDGLRFVALA